MASSRNRKKTATKAKTTMKARAKAKPAARTAQPARPAKQAATKPAEGKGLTLRAVAPSFTVDDVQKSLAWYRDVMGFAVGERWEDKGKLMGVELQAGPSSFMIGQDDWAKGHHRIKGAGFRLYCRTDQDVDRLAEGIKARGGSLLQEPKDEEWGGRAFTVQDPDGFKITISQER
jgi:uncharacterized glyoxalase superfamily protein PhnB